MTHVDLFSGIGGFALASTWVWGKDYQNLGHSEIEPYACKVYHRHFPESECLGDVTKIGWERFTGTVDLLTGGFPCQPHSVAGQRKASADERDLWGECKRAVRLVRPRYALFENVPGLLTSERGGFFNRVLSDLAEIGYDAEWYTIGAWQVGAPHKRDRIWIVAYPVSARTGNICGKVRTDNRRGTWRDEPPFRQRDGENGTDRTVSASTTENKVAHAEFKGLEGHTGDGADSGESRRLDSQQDRSTGPGGLRHSSITGLPDWSGGEMGQPWPVTEFERPIGKAISDTKGSGRLRTTEQKDDGEDIQRGWGLDVDNKGESRKSNREIERDFCGVAHGVSCRVDRLKGLGNAIVPQVAYVILEAIKRQMEAI